jgi:hypothetical protein
LGNANHLVVVHNEFLFSVTGTENITRVSSMYCTYQDFVKWPACCYLGFKGHAYLIGCDRSDSHPRPKFKLGIRVCRCNPENYKSNAKYQVSELSYNTVKGSKLSSPVTGLEWARGFQEFKVLRFHDNGTGWW